MLNWNIIIIPFLISCVLTPAIKKYSIWAKAYAKENNRTVHHGIISRIGGIAIYCAFLITVTITMDPDQALMGIIYGGSIMFFTGLVDDLIDIRPPVKLFFQLIAAIVLIINGVSVDVIHLPFGIVIHNEIISVLFTIIWVAGITNSINLIDGLDGLAGGMSVIMLVVIASMAWMERRLDVAMLSFILAASTSGFLIYNSHPASIFMGDCGSLFLGFMISAISL